MGLDRDYRTDMAEKLPTYDTERQGVVADDLASDADAAVLGT